MGHRERVIRARAALLVVGCILLTACGEPSDPTPGAGASGQRERTDEAVPAGAGSLLTFVPVRGGVVAWEQPGVVDAKQVGAQALWTRRTGEGWQRTGLPADLPLLIAVHGQATGGAAAAFVGQSCANPGAPHDEGDRVSCADGDAAVIALTVELGADPKVATVTGPVASRFNPRGGIDDEASWWPSQLAWDGARLVIVRERSLPSGAPLMPLAFEPASGKFSELTPDEFIGRSLPEGCGDDGSAAVVRTAGGADGWSVERTGQLVQVVGRELRPVVGCNAQTAVLGPAASAPGATSVRLTVVPLDDSARAFDVPVDLVAAPQVPEADGSTDSTVPAEDLPADVMGYSAVPLGGDRLLVVLDREVRVIDAAGKAEVLGRGRFIPATLAVADGRYFVVRADALFSLEQLEVRDA